MQLAVIPVTPFQQNCSVLWCESTRQAAVIDPGGELDRILDFVAEHQLELVKILLAHAHVDHAAATAELAERCHLPIEGPHRDDDFWIQGLRAAAAPTSRSATRGSSCPATGTCRPSAPSAGPTPMSVTRR